MAKSKKSTADWKFPGNKGRCKVCLYMEAHPRSDINRRLMAGEPVTTVCKDVPCNKQTMYKHLPHIGNRQLKQAKASREAKEGLDLLKCQKEVYDKAMKAAGMALGEIDTPPTANISAFGSCIAPATKIVEVLAKIDDKPQVTQTNITNNYDNLSKEELRELVKLTTKIEGSEEGSGEEKPA